MGINYKGYKFDREVAIARLFSIENIPIVYGQNENNSIY